MNSPNTSNNATPSAVVAPKPRRSKRQQDATFGTRRSQRALKRRHAGNDTRIYGEDYGILPSDCSKVAASAIPDRVPLGFICGYPVGAGGELYGGSMFHPSAATDTLQGRAIQKINEVWGEEHRGWADYKNIGIPVCKKKYKPFEFRIKKKNKHGGVEIQVVRMYGCMAHSNIRKRIIEQHGERNGWEPFGQWSMGKAKTAARRETQRLNAALNNSSSSFSDTSSSGYDSARSSSSSEVENATICLIEDKRQQQPFQSLCSNGSCNWKLRGKFDDICSEIEEERLNE